MVALEKKKNKVVKLVNMSSWFFNVLRDNMSKIIHQHCHWGFLLWIQRTLHAYLNKVRSDQIKPYKIRNLSKIQEAVSTNKVENIIETRRRSYLVCYAVVKMANLTCSIHGSVHWPWRTHLNSFYFFMYCIYLCSSSPVINLDLCPFGSVIPSSVSEHVIVLRSRLMQRD